MKIGDKIVVMRSGKTGIIQGFYKAIGGEGVIVRIDDKNIDCGYLTREVRVAI